MPEKENAITYAAIFDMVRAMSLEDQERLINEVADIVAKKKCKSIADLAQVVNENNEQKALLLAEKEKMVADGDRLQFWAISRKRMTYMSSTVMMVTFTLEIGLEKDSQWQILFSPDLTTLRLQFPYIEPVKNAIAGEFRENKKIAEGIPGSRWFKPYWIVPIERIIDLCAVAQKYPNENVRYWSECLNFIQRLYHGGHNKANKNK